RQEALEIEVCLRAPVVGRHDGGRAAARQSEPRVTPTGAAWPELVNRAGHVLVDRGVDGIATRRDLVDHGMRAGCVEHGYRLRASAACKGHYRISDEGPLADLPAGHRPGVLQS